MRSDIDGGTTDIGVVGLGTSHAESFSEILATRADVNVAAVWDGGAVRDDAYVEEFRRTFGASQYEDPCEMVGSVDGAMVLTANWDRHRELAVPFLLAGVPTFVDKPVAGSVADVDAIGRAAREGGASMFGGSAVPFHPSLEQMRLDDGPHDLFTAGYNGPFYYGVHLSDAARRISGADWVRVSPDEAETAVAIEFANGSTATLRLDGPTRDAAFGVLDVGSSVRTARIDGNETELDRMYRPFMDAFLATVSGERDDTTTLLDAARLILAVQVTLDTDETVTPDCGALRSVSRDGGSFIDQYEPLY